MADYRRPYLVKKIPSTKFQTTKLKTLYFGIWNLVLGACILEFGAWCLYFGIWNLVLGIWNLVLVFWNLVLGACILEFGIWCLVLGIWCLYFGIWNLEFGAWNLEFGAWNLEFHPTFSAKIRSTKAFILGSTSSLWACGVCEAPYTKSSSALPAVLSTILLT